VTQIILQNLTISKVSASAQRASFTRTQQQGVGGRRAPDWRWLAQQNTPPEGMHSNYKHATLHPALPPRSAQHPYSRGRTVALSARHPPAGAPPPLQGLLGRRQGRARVPPRPRPRGSRDWPVRRDKLAHQPRARLVQQRALLHPPHPRLNPIQGHTRRERGLRAPHDQFCSAALLSMLLRNSTTSS